MANSINSHEIITIFMKTPMIISKEHLSFAFEYGNAKTLNLFINCKFFKKFGVKNVKFAGKSLLHYACVNESYALEVIELFLSYPGIDVNVKNEDNQTAIEANVMVCNTDVINVIKNYKK